MFLQFIYSCKIDGHDLLFILCSSLFSQKLPINTSIGQETLESRGLLFDGYFFWISFGALIGFAVIFNVGFTLTLTFLKRKFVYWLYEVVYWMP